DAEEVIELTTRGLPRGSDLLDLRVRFGLFDAVEGVRYQVEAGRVLFGGDLAVGHELAEFGGHGRDRVEFDAEAANGLRPRVERGGVQAGPEPVLSVGEL